MEEKLVTPYINSQFPAYYRENYPAFVEFVRMYYSWLQQAGNAVGEARRLDDYKDVDLTKDEYLLYFKDKYLPFLKFVTETDKRTIIKHVLDLYRSKGTERGIDLFFKLVYGAPADVYYPSTDLFRLSDNQWIKKSYLEVSYNGSLRQFVGKKVVGTKTGATAFVEQYVVKKVGPKYSYLLYISSLAGDFETGENVKFDGLGSDFYPRIVGSLTSLQVTEAGAGFEVGDLVNLSSESGGRGGIARVANVYNTTGLVEFTLVDGGWGYSEFANVYVSEKNLSVSNIVPDFTLNNVSAVRYNKTPYFSLEGVYQPLARLDGAVVGNSVSIEFAAISNSVTLTSYYANASVISTVRVLTVSSSNASSGNLFVYLTSGNSQINTHFWSPSNTYRVDVSNYVDQTATGNVVGSNTTITAYFSNATAQFAKGQSLYQTSYVNGDPSAPYVSATANVYSALWGGSTGVLVLQNVDGIFAPTVNVGMIYANGVDSGKIAYLNSYDGVVGIANVTNGFTAIGNSQIRFKSSNTVAGVTLVGGGKSATFSVGNSSTLGYPEQIALFTDMLNGNNTLNQPYMGLALNAAQWNFPHLPTGNLSSIIDQVLTSYTGNIGSITVLTGINPGEDYTSAPFVYVADPFIAGFGKRDYVATLKDTLGNYIVGEEVTQSGGGKGIVKYSNTTYMTIKRASLEIDLVSGSMITGSVSGATSNVVTVREEASAGFTIGADAVVTANVKTESGSVSQLDVIDSGYNFIDLEGVTFASQDGKREGQARGYLGKQGVSKGTIFDEGSFLSAGKYLFDGYYWQEYSYDIQAPVTKDVFEQNYMQTMHVAGTKMFSTFTYSSINSQNINAFLPEGTANTTV